MVTKIKNYTSLIGEAVKVILLLRANKGGSLYVQVRCHLENT